MKKRVISTLAGVAIGFGGVAVSAPTAVAAPDLAPAATTAAASATQFDVGIYVYPECVSLGSQYQLYYIQQGYGSSFQCIQLDNVNWLLRVYVWVR